jgi:hypothetical protein
MKKIYLFISGTKTGVSKCVSFFTRSKNTHSTLSLNGKFDCMYTFGRFTLKPLPSGFVKENIRTNVLKKYDYCPCKIFEIDLTDEQYTALLAEIKRYEGEKQKYKYAILGAFLCAFRIKKTFKYKRFCSQFVANLLHDGAGLPLPYDTSLMRPKDFLTLDYIKPVYEGSIRSLAEKVDSGALVLPTE